MYRWRHVGTDEVAAPKGGHVGSDEVAAPKGVPDSEYDHLMARRGARSCARWKLVCLHEVALQMLSAYIRVEPKTRITLSSAMRILPLLLLPLLILSACSAPSQPPFDQLEADLQARAALFAGDVGIHLKHLPTGREIAIQADTVFPTASMIKVPLAVRIAELVDEGVLHYDSLHTYEDRLFYPGSDVVGAMRAGETISLRKMVFLSLSFSDNTASLWMQELGGTGTMVNEAMARLGLEHTRVNSRTEGRQDAFRRYGWGQTTPREMSALMEMIFRGEVINETRSDELYRLLSKTLWDETGLLPIPSTVNVASKQGSVSASRSETMVVNAPAGDYVLTVVTKNQQDRSWGDDNEGFVLIRDVSRIVWNALGEKR